MKIILEDNNKYMLRFDKDEEVFAGVMQFMKDKAIAACVFNGIGAASSLEMGYYNPHMKDFRKKPFLEDLEIVSFSGNGAMTSGEPALHVHGVFARNDFSTVGGHVFKLTVSATCELFVTKLEGEIKREMNSDLNLNILV